MSMYFPIELVPAQKLRSSFLLFRNVPMLRTGDETAGDGRPPLGTDRQNRGTREHGDWKPPWRCRGKARGCVYRGKAGNPNGELRGELDREGMVAVRAELGAGPRRALL